MVHLSRITFSVLVLALLLLTSCCSSKGCFCGCSGSKHISVLSLPIDNKVLASVHVNTPDHRHQLNHHGQKIYVSWKLPKEYFGQTLSGVLKIRFKIPKQIEIPFEISSLSGKMCYDVLDEEYFSGEGVLAYQVKIFIGDQVVDSFQHKMWTELISFDQN